MKERLTRAVIYQEYCDLLWSVKEAVILAQMVYRQQRVKDFDIYQNDINKKNIEHWLDEVELSWWWFYKTNDELSNEVRICKADAIGTWLNKLVELWYLFKRKNPTYKWDRTNQYMVNIIKLRDDLKSINLTIPNYEFSIPTNNYSIPIENLSIPIKSVSIPTASGAISETTTEIKQKNNNIVSFEKKDLCKSNCTWDNTYNSAAAFDSFWKCYPRKVDKKRSSIAFIRCISSWTPADVIIKWARLYGLASKTKDIKYIKHPTTWLNWENWNDEIELDYDAIREDYQSQCRADIDNKPIIWAKFVEEYWIENMRKVLDIINKPSWLLQEFLGL